MSAEAITENFSKIATLPLPATGMERAVLNNALLDGLCSRFFTPNLVKEAILAGNIPLKELSQGLNFSGIQELSPLQHKVYDAITDPVRYVQSMPEIAWDLGLRNANFQRLRGKVYSHLGVRGRGQAIVFRLAGEVNPIL